MEFGTDFFPDLIAASLDSWTDGGLQVTRTRAKMTEHLAHTLLHDSLDGAAPAGMEDADGVMLRIHQNDWEAVSSLDGNEQAGRTGDQAIARERLLGNVIDAVNDVGMNLPQGYDRPEWLFYAGSPGRRCSQVPQENRTVSLDGSAGVMLGESEIQVAIAIDAGMASDTGGEAVDEPRELVEMTRAKDGELGFV